MDSPAASKETLQVVQARELNGFTAGSKLKFVRFFTEADGIGRHEDDSNDTSNSRARGHRRWLWSKHESPHHQKDTEQSANSDKNDMEATE